MNCSFFQECDLKSGRERQLQVAGAYRVSGSKTSMHKVERL